VLWPGYAPTTRRIYLCCVAHFAHWLTTEHHALSAVSEAAVRRFVAEHLPRCDCSYPVRRNPHDLRAALTQLLAVLRAEGAIANDAASTRGPNGQEMHAGLTCGNQKRLGLLVRVCTAYAEEQGENRSYDG
jgi:integrase/recombinase XerD